MSLTAIHVSVIRNLITGIVPTTDTPGAADLPVTEMLQATYETWPVFRQSAFRYALEQVEALALATYGIPSGLFTQEMSVQFVEEVAKRTEFRAFWVPFRTMVVLMYYGHPAGADSIGMPGPSIDTGGFTADGERVGEVA